MKRLWIGVGFLAVLLLLGSLITWGFQRIHDPLAQTLEAAAQAAMEENWLQATVLAQQAESDWRSTRDLVATVIDHTSLEQMEAQFAQLSVHRQGKNRDAFAAMCVSLAAQVRAIGDTQAIHWWSVL